MINDDVHKLKKKIKIKKSWKKVDVMELGRSPHVESLSPTS